LKANFLKNKVFINSYLFKILALFLSFTLWFFVLNSNPIEVERKIKLKFILPTGHAISNVVTKKLLVTYKGPRTYLRGANFDEKNIFINLKKLKRKGKNKINLKLQLDDIPTAFGVNPIKFSPTTLRVELNKKIYKSVPIKAIFKNTVQNDYKLKSFDIKPSKIMIEGPINMMREQSLVKTLPIDLSNLKGKSKKEIYLESLDARVRFKEEKEVKVYLNYEIRPIKGREVTRRVKIRFLSSKRNFKVKTVYANVTFLISKKVAIQDVKKKIEVIANLPEGVKGRKNIPLKVNLPDNVHLLKVDPAYIKAQL